MSLNTFSGKAKFYHSRPTYPAECIDYLIQAYGLDENSVIADIGAGTGILSIPFLERGMTVFSVEPNNDMFVELSKGLSQYQKSTCFHNTAENTGLTDRSCDLIVVGSALHWFDIDKFRLECKRILKKEQVAVLSIYSWFDSTKKLLNSPDYLDKHAETAKEFFAPLKMKEKQFEYKLDYDCDRFVNDMLSRGDAPLPDENGFEKYVAKLKHSYEKFYNNKRAEFPFLAKCFTAIENVD